MRAEMTVGLDLCSLENLKIFNGYDVVKKERRKSWDDLSSPDDNNNRNQDIGSDWQRSKSAANKQKCGRPANPIPRHKRNSHIQAEYKRRDKIQKGFDTLITLVPELGEAASNKESKSSMLFKTAEHCRRLKAESGTVQAEMSHLRQELQALGTQIHDLQDALPKQGVESSETWQMDALYNQYIKEQTQKNWKFWVFCFFMRPLYKSYQGATTGTMNNFEFTRTVTEWLQDTLSLTNLRKGFFETLRKISIRTGIMNNPANLEQEARSSLEIHYMLPPLEVPAESPRSRVPTPIQTPTLTPRVTPVATPTPTPPRTPTASRRNSKRESRKSAGNSGNRSRSNTPPSDTIRQKRRSSYKRTEKNIQAAILDLERNNSVKYSNAQPISSQGGLNLPIIYRVNSATSASSQDSFRKPNKYAVSSQPISFQGTLSPSLVNTAVSPVSTQVVTSQYSPVAQKTDFTQSNSSTIYLQPAQDSKTSSNALLATSVNSTPTCPEVVMSSNCHQNSGKPTYSFKQCDHLKMEVESSLMNITNNIPVTTSPDGASFISTDGDSVSSSNPLLPLDQTIDETFSEFMIPDIPLFPMETLTSSHSSSDNLLSSLSVFTTAQPTVLPHETVLDTMYTTSALGQTSYNSSSLSSGHMATQIMNGDEDSMMKMLTVDVMDMNLVMTFFDNPQSDS